METFKTKMSNSTCIDFLSSCDGYIDPNPAAQRTVTLSDLRYVLQVLGVGLFCASVTFFLEMMIYKVIQMCRIKKTEKPLSDESLDDEEIKKT